MAKTTLHVAAKTDVGMVRDHNEDTVAFREPKDEAEATAKGYLLMVADGMGGHAAGEVASTLAAETILDEYYRHPSSDVEDALEDAFQKANERIHRQGEQGSGLTGMGTTCVAVVVRDSTAIIAHVGDSRVYLIRDGKIRQMTEDHSWVQEQVRAQILDPEEAKTHPMRNIITRALGNAPEIAVEFSQLAVHNRDRFLLCSDGLSNMVSGEQMRDVLLEEADLDKACDILINAANEHGGPDNISVVVAVIEKDEAEQEVTQPLKVLAAAPTEDRLATTAEMDLAELVERLEEAKRETPVGEDRPAPAPLPEAKLAPAPPSAAAAAGSKPPLIKSAEQIKGPATRFARPARAKPAPRHVTWAVFFAILGGIILVSLAAGALFLIRVNQEEAEEAARQRANASATAAGLSAAGQGVLPTPPASLPSPTVVSPGGSFPAPGTSAVPGGRQGQGEVREYVVKSPPDGRFSVNLYEGRSLYSGVAGQVGVGEKLDVRAIDDTGDPVYDSLGNNVSSGGGRWFWVVGLSGGARGWLPSHWAELQ